MQEVFQSSDDSVFASELGWAGRERERDTWPKTIHGELRSLNYRTRLQLA